MNNLKVGSCASIQELIILYKQHSQMCRFNITSIDSLYPSQCRSQPIFWGVGTLILSEQR